MQRRGLLGGSPERVAQGGRWPFKHCHHEQGTYYSLSAVKNRHAILARRGGAVAASGEKRGRKRKAIDDSSASDSSTDCDDRPRPPPPTRSKPAQPQPAPPAPPAPRPLPTAAAQPSTLVSHPKPLQKVVPPSKPPPKPQPKPLPKPPPKPLETHSSFLVSHPKPAGKKPAKPQPLPTPPSPPAPAPAPQPQPLPMLPPPRSQPLRPAALHAALPPLRLPPRPAARPPRSAPSAPPAESLPPSEQALLREAAQELLTPSAAWPDGGGASPDELASVLSWFLAGSPTAEAAAAAGHSQPFRPDAPCAPPAPIPPPQHVASLVRAMHPLLAAEEVPRRAQTRQAGEKLILEKLARLRGTARPGDTPRSAGAAAPSRLAQPPTPLSPGFADALFGAGGGAAQRGSPQLRGGASAAFEGVPSSGDASPVFTPSEMQLLLSTLSGGCSARGGGHNPFAEGR